MHFIKVQGTLNDFVLIDERCEIVVLTDKDRGDWAKLLCNRASGIGADGVLYVGDSDAADAKMRIFNADGSEALMCGNGLRCFGRYILEGLDKPLVTVETLKAIYTVTLDPDFDQRLMGYNILLDNVRHFGASEEVLRFQAAAETTLNFQHLTVSNPHIVAFCTAEELSDANLIPLGIRANEDRSIFTEGMNVNLVQVLGPDRIYVRTYERGVGITKSCGTGMTSSVTAYAAQTDQLDKWIQVVNDGGKILCRVRATAEGYAVDFTGNATWVYEGKILSHLDQALSFVVEHDYTAESQQFQAFFEETRQSL